MEPASACVYIDKADHRHHERLCSHRGFVFVRYRCILVLSDVVRDIKELLLCSDFVLFVLNMEGLFYVFYCIST